MPYLHWLTRDDDIKKAKVAPYRLLEPAPELSAGDPHSPNMLIQGDNLEALKALLPRISLHDTLCHQPTVDDKFLYTAQ